MSRSFAIQTLFSMAQVPSSMATSAMAAKIGSRCVCSPLHVKAQRLKLYALWLVSMSREVFFYSLTPNEPNERKVQLGLCGSVESPAGRPPLANILFSIQSPEPKEVAETPASPPDRLSQGSHRIFTSFRPFLLFRHRQKVVISAGLGNDRNWLGFCELSVLSVCGRKAPFRFGRFQAESGDRNRPKPKYGTFIAPLSRRAAPPA
jgi:hypothetical protein